MSKQYHFYDAIPAALTTIYTVPAGVYQFIQAASIYNDHSGSITASLYILRASGAIERLMSDGETLASKYFRDKVGLNVPLEPGDSIKANASEADVFFPVIHLKNILQ